MGMRHTFIFLNCWFIFFFFFFFICFISSFSKLTYVNRACMYAQQYTLWCDKWSDFFFVVMRSNSDRIDLNAPFSLALVRSIVDVYFSVSVLLTILFYLFIHSFQPVRIYNAFSTLIKYLFTRSHIPSVLFAHSFTWSSAYRLRSHSHIRYSQTWISIYGLFPFKTH